MMATADLPEVPLMTFPAILRNPGLNNRLAHLQVADNEQSSHNRKSTGPTRDKEGKRRIRRRENGSSSYLTLEYCLESKFNPFPAKFASNPHIVAPSSRDYVLSKQSPQSTFPEPLPSFLSRSTQAPSYVPPSPDPQSSTAGQFTLALKGVRKDLRRSGGRAEQLVKEIETGRCTITIPLYDPDRRAG